MSLESVNVSESNGMLIVQGSWSYATQEEVAAYVRSLKDAGFTVDPTESKPDNMYTYSASNAKASTKPNVIVRATHTRPYRSRSESSS